MTGCAQPPGELVRQGERHQYSLTRTPGEAGDCIVRNAEKLGANISAGMQRLSDGGAEVVIRADGAPLVYFHIESVGLGTTEASAFISYEAAADRRGYTGSLVRGC